MRKRRLGRWLLRGALAASAVAAVVVGAQASAADDFVWGADDTTQSSPLLNDVDTGTSPATSADHDEEDFVWG